MTDELLAKLPARVQIDESIAWLTLNKFDDGFQAGYLHGDGVYEKQLSFTAQTAQEALEMLAECRFLSEASGENNGSSEQAKEGST